MFENFHLIRNDRIVVAWLIIVIGCAIGIILFVDEKKTIDNYLIENQNNPKQNDAQNPRYAIATSQQELNLHPFDLNTATPSEMTSLGFNQRQIRSVMNYRSKGGIYRQVQQMSKISGMTKGQYDRLAPYFRVSQDYLPASQFVTIPKYPYSAPKQQQQPTKIRTTPIVSEAPALDKPTSKIKPGETIDLNSADTTDLKRIPGVGSAFAKMIINYRNRLGGFYSISQLNDLQALPTDVHQYATIAEQPNIRKLKINTLSINQLVNHPYINYYKARAITEYIRLKGKITDIRELQLNRNFTPNDIQRLAPYLDYE